MKKLLLLIPLCLLSTSSVARVTMEDVNRDMAWFAAQNPTVPQSVIDKQWNDYNQPPEEDGSMGIETIRVEGAQALGVWSKSYAQCPTNYKLTGGGYLLTTFNGGHGYNAPNGSFADTDRNRWVVERGGMPENRGFKAYAICMKK